ncbi:Serine/threonine kinase [Mortierella polycephala]|uniref:protein kinase C n=1 Tax=Mortierella polycephala TaxID=41804 RepID=A0A9P6Q7Q5_9FUNG|nr:Serine/threonine kinase [Mortierella polycephala]
MRTRHTNPTAIAQCEITLQESQKRIDYLTKEIEKLQIRQSHQQQQQRIQQQHQHQHQHQNQHQQHQHHNLHSHDYASVSDSSMDPILTGEDEYKDRDLVSDSGPYLAGDFGPVPAISPDYRQSVAGSSASLGSGTTMDSPQLEQAILELPKKPTYTNVDLLKSSTPITTAKISSKLRELAFKLDVEKKLKAGSERLAVLYKNDPSMGDKKNRAGVNGELLESNEKIVILKRSLQKYQQLFVPGMEDDDDSEPEVTNRVGAGLRKPNTGTLHIQIIAVKQQNNAPTRTFKSPETLCMIKVDGVPRAKTRPVRSGTQGARWNEDFDVPVEKASEVELTLYDRPDHHLIPIGILWIKISDITDELRRKKVELESGPGWAPAGVAGQVSADDQGQFDGQAPSGAGFNEEGGAFNNNNNSNATVDGIESWFDLEPVGQICLKFNFVKDAVGVKRYPSRLGRAGAVRKRKGEIKEVNGHKFAIQQFYQIMRCALCSDLFSGAGAQCEDCKYTCHRKCFEKVVTKCISKSKVDEDPDEEKLNHRIPHRFEAFTNLSASWCCHCGYILPLGKKGAKKCTECNITSHAACSHLVPDFCGMDMEKANMILMEIKRAKRHTTDNNRMNSASTLSSRYSVPRPSQSESGHSSPVDSRFPLGSHRPEPGSPDSRGSYRQPTSPQSPLSSQSTPMSQNLPQPTSPRQPPPKLQMPPHSIASQGGSFMDQGPEYGAPISSSLSSLSLKHEYEPEEPGQLQLEIEHQMLMQQQQQHQTQQQQQEHQRLQQEHQQRLQQQEQAQQQRMQQEHQLQLQQQQMQQQQQQYQQYQHQQQQQHHQMQQQQYQQQQYGQQRPSQHQQQTSQIVKKPQQQVGHQPRKVGLDDFNFLAVLGKGNFGKVMLAEDKITKGLYAIKVLKKEFIIEHDEVASTRSEKRVFQTANKERHPFLVGLHSCFQTETRIYFVMDYVSGGDLMLHIQREQFSERQAKFYACQVLLALEYFHKNNIIYRDLKLDNILLALDGHIKIADYGLCKEDMYYGSTTNTFCGTPEFMAPEILSEQKYGRAVDWWAFGVLIYEMLLGKSPFRGDDEDEIFEAILEDEILYPINMSRDSVSILQKLLTRDPEKRLGSGKTDAEEIRRHPFFKGVNWQDILDKKVPPPFFPKVRGPTDTSNFDVEFTREVPVLTPVHSHLTVNDQANFQGFSYVAEWL